MLNKPIYVGFNVLELSKWMMYNIHCNFIKKNFNAELLVTDADSLTSEKIRKSELLLMICWIKVKDVLNKKNRW